MRSHSVGYFSSYDRGLVTLLEMWPAIRKAVPDATLDIAYGWNGYDEMHRNDPKQMKWKWQVIRMLHDLKSQGVTEHGRLSHEDLAAMMKRTKVWAYPTTFSEINCITALKTQRAGMIPVTTGCYALAESVINNDYTVFTEQIDEDDDKRKEFVVAVIAALNATDYTVAFDEGWYWENIAKEWDTVCAPQPSLLPTTNPVS